MKDFIKSISYIKNNKGDATFVMIPLSDFLNYAKEFDQDVYEAIEDEIEDQALLHMMLETKNEESVPFEEAKKMMLDMMEE